MIPEPYYINLGRGLQAVHRFFLGNGDKNVSRETWQLTIDNGQLTICPGMGNVCRGRDTERRRGKTVRPARGGPRGYPYYGMYIQKYTETDGQKIAGGRGVDCMEVPIQLGRLDVHHLRTLNANTCNKAAGTLRGRGVSSLK